MAAFRASRTRPWAGSKRGGLAGKGLQLLVQKWLSNENRQDLRGFSQVAARGGGEEASRAPPRDVLLRLAVQGLDFRLDLCLHGGGEILCCDAAAITMLEYGSGDPSCPICWTANPSKSKVPRGCLTSSRTLAVSTAAPARRGAISRSRSSAGRASTCVPTAVRRPSRIASAASCWPRPSRAKPPQTARRRA